MKPRVQQAISLRNFLKTLSETQISIVFSKNRNLQIKNEFASGFWFLDFFWKNTYFQVFVKTCSKNNVTVWPMALTGHKSPENKISWIFLILRKSNFSQKTENVRFLRKMQKTQGNNEMFLQKLVKYTHKSSKFGGKPAQKIIWRFGTWRSPGTNLQKPTFPEISCFFGNRKISRNLSFSNKFRKSLQITAIIIMNYRITNHPILQV